MIIIENVVAIFRFDCFICAMNGTNLKEFMMKKHKWSEEQFKEFMSVYRTTLCTSYNN